MYGREWNGAGKVVIVTGPTGIGIGMHTARFLAERGAHVILAGRTPRRLEEAEAAIRAAATNADGTRNENIQLTQMVLDLGSLASVKSFAEKFLALNLPLHVLINNAGMYVWKGTCTT